MSKFVERFLNIKYSNIKNSRFSTERLQKLVNPLKKFGQNYLRDRNTINKIIAGFNPQPADTVLEIGPGQGAITEGIAAVAGSLTCIEIDTRVIDDLKERFPQVSFLNEDVLKADIRQIPPPGGKMRVIGNIPYNITSPIIFRLIENRDIVSDATLMVQYEVARRLAASSGNKDYGILSVILGAVADIKLMFKIPPTVFYPKPNVDSAVISISFGGDKPVVNDFAIFRKVVKAAFGKRRKTLRNSLLDELTRDFGITSIPVDTGLRAEQLTVQQFTDLSNYVSAELLKRTTG